LYKNIFLYNKMRKKNIPYDILNTALTNPSISRMIKEFNIQHINHLVYEEIRGELKVKLEELLYKVHILLQYKKKKTITLNDIYFLMDKPKLFLKDKNLEKCIKGNNIECLYFQKTPFRDLIYLTLQDENYPYRMNHGVSILIQYYLETYLKDIIKKTYILLQSKNKKTLLPRDIKTVLLI